MNHYTSGDLFDQDLFYGFQRLRDILLDLALPNGHDRPSSRPELLDLHLVALDIPFEFLMPELLVGLGERKSAGGTAVPETAIDEDRYMLLGKSDVRPTREVLPVNAVTFQPGRP